MSDDGSEISVGEEVEEEEEEVSDLSNRYGLVLSRLAI